MHRSGPRYFELEKGINFRDFGGYPAEHGGKSVRWGKLFRSGRLTALTERDQAVLESLRLNTVIDLRSRKERLEEPFVPPSSVVNYLVNDDTDGIGAVEVSLAAAQDTDLSSKQFMIRLYLDILAQNERMLSRLFTCLLADKGPLLVKCSAGKDRTGLAVALVLSALGADRKTILHDYSLSADLVDYRSVFASRLDVDSVTSMNVLKSLPEHLLEAILESRPEYLALTLSDIENTYQSINEYMSIAFGIGPREIDELRKIYLV